MKCLYFILSISIISIQLSCNSIEQKNNTKKDENLNSEKSDSVSVLIYTIDTEKLTKDFMTWYNYTYHNIRLSQDFIGLDIDAKKINKATFLNKLMTENVVVLKTKVVNGQSVYQLFKHNSEDESIKATIKQMASTELAFNNMEGIDIHDFDFVDLTGARYTKASTKGKIVVLKCWFIGCVPCVKEFPELNKLVDDHRDRKDILFISLALDSREDLVKFFKTKEFKYATVPNMRDFITGKLNVMAFPTHVLIDKTGKIIKIVNRIEDLLPYLKREI